MAPRAEIPMLLKKSPRVSKVKTMVSPVHPGVCRECPNADVVQGLESTLCAVWAGHNCTGGCSVCGVHTLYELNKCRVFHLENIAALPLYHDHYLHILHSASYMELLHSTILPATSITNHTQLHELKVQ